MKKFASIACAFLCLCACSKGDYFGDMMVGEMAPSDGAVSGDGDGNQGNPNQDSSRILTAGEWNDLENWDFWAGLLEKDEFKGYCQTWGFNTEGRVAVKLSTSEGKPAIGCKVELRRGEQVLWESRSDNKGLANCWPSIFELNTDTSSLSLYIDGVKQEKDLLISYLQDKEVKLNEFTVNSSANLENSIDIAFLVDATGSMCDEINFLKSDLVNILERSSSFDENIKIRSAALFYRDKGDEYLCKQQNFSLSPSETADYVKKQSAGGGGDYEEAVHTALENGLQELSWNSKAISRIAFLILDAPAHAEKEVYESLHNSIRLYAQKGISIIPLAASGANKYTEFMLRLFAISTGGSYTFLTNDSGVGGDHIEASVGDYQVELLNDLMVRLITERMKI